MTTTDTATETTTGPISDTAIEMTTGTMTGTADSADPENPAPVRRIALLSALDKEAEVLVSRLEGAKNVDRFGITITTGRLHGLEAAVAVGGMGKVAAAAAAQALIAAYSPDALVFSGIAGSISPRLEVGDIVLGRRLIAMETNAAIIAECRPWMTWFPSDPHLLGLAARAAAARRFSRTPSLMEEAAQAQGPQEPQGARRQQAASPVAGTASRATSGTLDYSGEPEGTFGSGRRFMVGTITSSDQFNTDPDVLAHTREVIHGDCEEMEGSAAAQVAVKNGVPFLAIRSMSNKCGEAYDDLDNHQLQLRWTAHEAANLADDVVALLAAENTTGQQDDIQ